MADYEGTLQDLRHHCAQTVNGACGRAGQRERYATADDFGDDLQCATLCGRDSVDITRQPQIACTLVFGRAFV